MYLTGFGEKNGFRAGAGYTSTEMDVRGGTSIEGLEWGQSQGVREKTTLSSIAGNPVMPHKFVSRTFHAYLL